MGTTFYKESFGKKGMKRKKFFMFICSNCGTEKERKYKHNDELKEHVFCSRKCQINSQKNGELKEKQKKIFLEKYGVENPSMIPEIRRKAEQTTFDRYGVYNASSCYEIKLKKEKAYIEKYGVSSPLKSQEIKEKVKNTNLERYGVEYPVGSQDFKIKTKEIYLKKYGVEHYTQLEDRREYFSKNNPQHIEEIKNKTKQTCQDRYGVDNIFKTKKSKDNFKLFLENNRFNLKSKEEQRFKDLILSPWADYNNFNIIEQYKIKCWFVDFYIPDINLLIMFDGVFWHAINKTFDELKELILKYGTNSIHKARYNNKQKDIRQNKYFEKCGYKLLRITDEEIKSFLKEKPSNENIIHFLNEKMI